MLVLLLISFLFERLDLSLDLERIIRHLLQYRIVTFLLFYRLGTVAHCAHDAASEKDINIIVVMDFLLKLEGTDNTRCKSLFDKVAC